MLRNLYISYAVTWVILGGYIVYLWRKHVQLKREEDALKK